MVSGISCKATKNNLGLPEFFNAMKGLKFAWFREWLISAPQVGPFFSLPW